MNIFGKSLSDYVRFERGFLILVLVVGVARSALSLLGVPNSTAKFLSLTVMFLLGMILLLGESVHQRLWELQTTAARVGAAGDRRQLYCRRGNCAFEFNQQR